MTLNLLLLLLGSTARATGLPPWEELVMVDAKCNPVQSDVGEIFVTFDRLIGTCAPPDPEGNSCSHWVDGHLDATELVVNRMDCNEPLAGTFEAVGMCQDRPLWRWNGTLHPGREYRIGRDFQPAQALFTAVGEPDASTCPAESPRVDAVTTPTSVSPPSAPQWLVFPAEGFSVATGDDGARLEWRPGSSLQHWMLGDAGVVFRSEPMPPATAQALLDGAWTEPMGLSVRYQIVAHREHFEGWRQRGVPQCTRVLTMDIEQQIRQRDESLSPSLRATVGLREPTASESCYPPEGPNP